MTVEDFLSQLKAQFSDGDEIAVLRTLYSAGGCVNEGLSPSERETVQRISHWAHHLAGLENVEHIRSEALRSGKRSLPKPSAALVG
jgi:hypothetical protein